MKRLSAVCVSTTSYLRNVFPDEAYGDKSFDGLALKILKKKSGCPEAEAIVARLGEVFKSIQAGFLRKLELGIYKSEDCEDGSLLESFVFRMCHSSKDQTLEQRVRNVKDAKTGMSKWFVRLPSFIFPPLFFSLSSFSAAARRFSGLQPFIVGLLVSC
jgi:hypothetical protein